MEELKAAAMMEEQQLYLITSSGGSWAENLRKLSRSTALSSEIC